MFLSEGSVLIQESKNESAGQDPENSAIDPEMIFEMGDS
jgi:hypothetical protein